MNLQLETAIARELAESSAGETNYGFIVVDNRPTGNEGRWVAEYELIIRYYGQRIHFMAHYDVGLTENQETIPFENDGPFVEFQEVEKVEVTTYEWKPKRN